MLAAVLVGVLGLGTQLQLAARVKFAACLVCASILLFANTYLFARTGKDIPDTTTEFFACVFFESKFCIKENRANEDRKEKQDMNRSSPNPAPEPVFTNVFSGTFSVLGSPPTAECNKSVNFINIHDGSVGESKYLFEINSQTLEEIRKDKEPHVAKDNYCKRKSQEMLSEEYPERKQYTTITLPKETVELAANFKNYNPIPEYDGTGRVVGRWFEAGQPEIGEAKTESEFWAKTLALDGACAPYNQYLKLYPRGDHSVAASAAARSAVRTTYRVSGTADSLQAPFWSPPVVTSAEVYSHDGIKCSDVASFRYEDVEASCTNVMKLGKSNGVDVRITGILYREAKDSCYCAIDPGSRERKCAISATIICHFRADKTFSLESCEKAK